MCSGNREATVAVAERWLMSRGTSVQLRVVALVVIVSALQRQSTAMVVEHLRHIISVSLHRS